MEYLKQLDSLRALAVFAVLYSHFIAWRLTTIPILKPLNWGRMGVDLFYVLSGFLITAILIKNKINVDNGNDTIVGTIKTFFIRRVLRIFPIYYLTLLVAFVLSVPNIRDLVWWHLTYTTNFFIAINGDWIPPVGHFWSLSVEEQFYLIWPWTVLLVPRRRLLGVIVFTIASAPTFRYVCSIVDPNTELRVMTLWNMDLFGAGALLAYFKVYSCMKSRGAQNYLKVCKTIGTFSFVSLIALKGFGYTKTLQIFFQTAEGLFYCWVIYCASYGFKGIPGRVMDFKPLLYLGKISYGIYLYHNFVPHLTSRILEKWQITLPESATFQVMLYITLTITIASISWYLVERPISLFKDRHTASKQNNAMARLICDGKEQLADYRT